MKARTPHAYLHADTYARSKTEGLSHPQAYLHAAFRCRWLHLQDRTCGRTEAISINVTRMHLQEYSIVSRNGKPSVAKVVTLLRCCFVSLICMLAAASTPPVAAICAEHRESIATY